MEGWSHPVSIYWMCQALYVVGGFLFYLLVREWVSTFKVFSLRDHRLAAFMSVCWPIAGAVLFLLTKIKDRRPSQRYFAHV